MGRSVGVLLALGLIAWGCSSTSNAPETRSHALESPDGGKCGPNEFLYDDGSCYAPGPVGDSGVRSGVPCEQAGDLLCHERCHSDADCTDPARRYCRVLGLWDGTDYGCDGGVLICRAENKDDCDRTTTFLH